MVFDPSSDDLERAMVLERHAVDLIPDLCWQVEEAERHIVQVASCMQSARQVRVSCVSEMSEKGQVVRRCSARTHETQTAFELHHLCTFAKESSIPCRLALMILRAIGPVT